MKRGAQEAAGKSGTMHASRVSDAKTRLDEAGRALREELRLTLELPDTQVPAGRNLFLGEGMQVRLGDEDVFKAGGVDLSVRGPERIALAGPNGAGKTTLMRLVSGSLAPESGEITRNDGRIAYLSQRLDLLDVKRTVAENFAAFAPERPEAERMNLLARFLFRGARAHLPVGVLSGGERLRATLACVLCAGKPRTCCCSTSPPTTSTWSARVSWRVRSTPTRAPSWWSATTSGSSPRSGSADGCGWPTGC